MAGSGSSAYGNNDVSTTSEVLVAARQARESVLIKNNHATQILYLGSDTNVTSTNGFPVAAGESVRIESKNAVWAIANGAATDVRYFEEF